MSTVNEKMTTLASRIRNYSDRTGKLSIDDMAIAVEDVYVFGMVAGRTQGYEQGYENGWADGLANGREEGKASVPFEVHKITVASDLISGANTLLANNEFVKKHYADEGFTIQLISLQTRQNVLATAYAYNSNRQLLMYGSNNATVYGIQISTTATNGYQTKAATSNVSTLTWSGVPAVNADGNVLIRASSGSYELLAGDYLLILSVAEV